MSNENKNAWNKIPYAFLVQVTKLSQNMRVIKENTNSKYEFNNE